MKRLIIALIYCVVGIEVTAQTLTPYPQPGLLQGDIYVGPWTNMGNHDASTQYISDTIISSTTYSYFTNQEFSDYYTRYDNGKVYWVCRNAGGSLCGSETLQYDFSLTVNDTFTSSILGKLYVDSVSTITLLNSAQRKYLSLRGAETWNSTRQYSWIDGIGDIVNGFLYASDFEGGYGKFVCHTDNSGLLYIAQPVEFDCDSLTGYVVGLPENKSTSALTLYPNPISNTLYIQLPQQSVKVQISLYDAKGKLIGIEQPSVENMVISMSVSSLSPGIYLAKVQSEIRANQGVLRFVKQ